MASKPRAEGSGRTRKTSGRRSGRQEDGSSARTRPQGAPPAAPKWLWIILAVVALGVVIAFFNMIRVRAAKTPKVVVDYQIHLDEVKDLHNEGVFHYRQGMQAPDAQRRKMELEIARDKLVKAAELYDKTMEPYEDASGELPPEYQGYESIRADIQLILYDLNKAMSAE